MRPFRFLSALAAPALLLGSSCAGGDGPSPGDTGEAAQALGQAFGGEVEPNDTAALATPIGTDTVVRADLFGSGDVDLYSFQAPAGARVHAAVMGAFSANGSSDSDLDVLGTDGVTVLETDDQDGSLGALSPSIAGTVLPAAGTYYLRVRHSSASGQQRPYHLHFRLQTGAPTPEVEPNDVTGQPLPASGWVSGTLSSASDVDLYTLNVGLGDTISASLDLDPTRDGTDLGASLFVGPFAGTFLQVNDAGGAGPDSEALFVTVRQFGTYTIGVMGTAAGDYGLSVSVHPAAPSAGCAIYSSVDVPKTIPAAGGQVTSTLTVPGSPRIGDVDVSVQLSHASMTDVDAHLISPRGNTNALFTDAGSAAYPSLSVTLDDEGAYPISSFPVLSGVVVTPGPNYRLHWLDGEDGGGTWTLVLNDDTNNAAGGTLLGWSVTICDAPIAPVACPFGPPVTALSASFEAGAQGFTHGGVQDEWALGTPSAAPITDCHGGTQCWKTDLSGTYEPSSDQDLVSPPIDLGQVVAPIQLQWAMKYQLETATTDHAWVEIREVGGANPRRLWQWLDANMVATVGATVLQESAGWGTHAADVSAYAGKQVELVFHLDSSAAGQFAGLAIDDVAVAGCPLSVCGNGLVEGSEGCDDANLVSGDGCDANCTPTGCGNGVTTAGEACDDGDAIDGDGCDTNCTPTGCGNGVTTAGELCDDGNGVLGDGCDDGPLGNCTASGCGNGITAGGEGCDDANLVDGDGCDNNCTVTGCGNGVISGAELCDDANQVSGDGCDNNCTPTGCGNGVQTAGEACDDANQVSGDGCDANCTPTGCGNGVQTAGEACDDGNPTEGDGCDTNCTPSGCGNGIQDPSEGCDDANTADGDGCSSLCEKEGAGGAGGGGAGGGGAGGGGAGGGGGGAGGGAGGGQGGNGGGISADGGCGCSVVGAGPEPGRWALALGLLGLGLSRRRRPVEA